MFRLLLHVERRAQHLGVAESHGLVQVVDAVQEVAVVPAGHAHDRIVSVMCAVLHETPPEEDQVLLLGGVPQYLGTRHGDVHHQLVRVAFVRRKHDVLAVAVGEDFSPGGVAVQLLDEVLNGLEEHPVHGAAVLADPV